MGRNNAGKSHYLRAIEVFLATKSPTKADMSKLQNEKRYLDVEEEAYINVDKPTFGERMNAMYTAFDGKTVQPPKDLITRDGAKSIIHTVRVALERIIETTEFWGHQIGTKEFMK